VDRYTPFTTVPLEIALEIMKQLDWLSLLNIRQVSTYMPFYFLLQGSCCSDMQFTQQYLEDPCCMEKPISSIRGSAHAVDTFRGTSGLVLNARIGTVDIDEKEC